MHPLIPFLIVLVLFLAVLSLPIADLHKFIIEVLILGTYGYYLHKRHNIEFYYGMLMLKTKQGLDKIDLVAHFSSLWKHFADIGIVMAFGVLSPILYPHVRKRHLFAGLTIILLSALLILPNLYSIALSVIAFPYDGVSTKGGMYSDSIDIMVTLVLVAIILIGYAGITTLSIVVQAGSILISIYSKFFESSEAVVQPGAALLLPGINLPLFEGAIALLMLLFVHEVAHAILSRVARVRLKSAGILLFGFIPVGAFVDPDEQVLSRKSASEQGRVLVAGSTANFTLSFLSFFLFIFLVSLPLDIYDTGVSIMAAREGLPLQKGDTIYSLNGVMIEDMKMFFELRESVEPNSTVQLSTSAGDFTLETDENAMIGVLLQPRIKGEYNWYVFLKNLFALMFALNFFVASVNLLPIPLFDGHRLLDIGMGGKRKLITKAIAYIASISLLLNLVPWLL